MSVSTSEASDDDDFSQYAPGHMPMPDFEALARDIQNRASRRVGVAMTETRHFREFRNERARCRKNMGVAREGLHPPRGWPPEAPALGPSFYEGVPQAEPGVFGRRRVCRRRRPEDPPQVGLGVYRRRRQPGRRCGE